MSALSVFEYPSTSSTISNDVSAGTSITDTGQAFMISGVAIRRNNISIQEAYSRSHRLDLGTEVSTMNQVNQALSDDVTPHIIDQPLMSHEQDTKVLNPFVSYLLMHDIQRSCKLSDMKHATPTSSLTSFTTNIQLGPSFDSKPMPMVGSKSAAFVPDCYMLPQILEMEESFMDVKEFSLSSNSSLANIPVGSSSPSSQPTHVSPVLPPPLISSQPLSSMSKTLMPTGSSVMGGIPDGILANDISVGSYDSSYVIPDTKYRRAGQVTQCVELPVEVTNSQVIRYQCILIEYKVDIIKRKTIFCDNISSYNIIFKIIFQFNCANT